MHYRYGAGGRCCIIAGQRLRMHSAGGGTFLREMRSWWL